MKYSEKLRNAGLDARIAALGPNPTLQLFDSGGKRLAQIALPNGWMSKAEGGVARKRGVWSAVAENKGEATRFAIHDAADDAHMSGNIRDEMTIDNPRLEKGQSVVVGQFVLTAGNATDA